jgi:hypothetical protein
VIKVDKFDHEKLANESRKSILNPSKKEIQHIQDILKNIGKFSLPIKQEDDVKKDKKVYTEKFPGEIYSNQWLAKKIEVIREKMIKERNGEKPYYGKVEHTIKEYVFLNENIGVLNWFINHYQSKRDLKREEWRKNHPYLVELYRKRAKENYYSKPFTKDRLKIMQYLKIWDTLVRDICEISERLNNKSLINRCSHYFDFRYVSDEDIIKVYNALLKYRKDKIKPETKIKIGVKGEKL